MLTLDAISRFKRRVHTVWLKSSTKSSWGFDLYNLHCNAMCFKPEIGPEFYKYIHTQWRHTLFTCITVRCHHDELGKANAEEGIQWIGFIVLCHFEFPYVRHILLRIQFARAFYSRQRCILYPALTCPHIQWLQRCSKCAKPNRL